MASESERALGDYYGRIYRFVRARSSTSSDAEDLTQTVFLEALGDLDRLKRDSRPLLGWLYTVAERRLVDAARRRRVRGVSLPLAESAVAAPASAYGRDIAEAIAAAIALLPEAQREAVLMRLVRGLSFAEIARATGVTEDACKMRVSRGLTAIRTRLEEEGLKP